MKIFSIDGYFTDSPESPFYGFLVAEYDSTPQGYSDDQIFFYGLSQSDIEELIKTGESPDDFVITAYHLYDER